MSHLTSQRLIRFGEEWRPVKLETKVIGYTGADNPFVFDKYVAAATLSLCTDSAFIAEH